MIEEEEVAFQDHDMATRDPLFNVSRTPVRKGQKRIDDADGKDAEGAIAGNGTPYRKGRDNKVAYTAALKKFAANEGLYSVSHSLSTV